MVMEQYPQETLARTTDSNKEHGASVEKWSSVSATVDGSENNPSCGGFDCNICLDSVQEPVVTLCGHLYCWPCIYKWIHFQGASAEKPNQQQQPQCPVCKAEVSQKTLVPLYGKGQTTKSSEGKAPNLGIVVPRRPSSPTCGVHTPTTTATTNTTGSHPPQQLHHRGYPQRSLQYPPQPMIGEMVYARIFGNSATTLDSAYPNSYNHVGSSSPRVRRHMMKVDESLNRVSFFIFCCIVLCLLLF